MPKNEEPKQEECMRKIVYVLAALPFAFAYGLSLLS